MTPGLYDREAMILALFPSATLPPARVFRVRIRVLCKCGCGQVNTFVVDRQGNVDLLGILPPFVETAPVQGRA